MITFLIGLICQLDAQFTNVELEQGAVIGLKVFPESSIPVYAFLGIPYAKPPVENLRFAVLIFISIISESNVPLTPLSPLQPPAPLVEGWNTSLLARNYKPICPQLEEQNPYENSELGSDINTGSMSEDCLYLNIWAPETGFRSGNLPVLVIITGEEQAFDWMLHRPTVRNSLYADTRL